MASTRFLPRFFVTAAIVLGVGLAAGVPQEPVFRPVRVASPFPPITRVNPVPAEAGDRELGPSELVLGVSLNGEARAYPINALTGPQREIINDQLGGIPIAATW